MTICPTALAFELELTCANEKCRNCGKVGMSCISEDAGAVVFAGQLICDILVRCIRCSCNDTRRIIFPKETKFSY